MLHVINPNTIGAAIVLPILSDLTNYDFDDGTIEIDVPVGAMLAVLHDIKKCNIREVSCCDVVNFDDIDIIRFTESIDDDTWNTEVFSQCSFLQLRSENPHVRGFINAQSDEEIFKFITDVYDWFENDDLQVTLKIYLCDIIHTRTYVCGGEVSIASVAIPVRDLRDVLQDQFDSIDRIDHPDTEEFTATTEMIFNLIESLFYR